MIFFRFYLTKAEFCGLTLKDVDLVSDVVGKKFSQDTEMTQLLIDTEFLDDPEGLIEEIWGSGDEYYLLYNNNVNVNILLYKKWKIFLYNYRCYASAS